jgi:tetratricopeptide (TPR) repeat protein
MDDEATLKNVAGVENAEESWSAWDPKNPDSPAVLAHFYLDEKVRLDKAVELLNQVQALYTAAIPKDAEPNSNRLYRDGIKSHVMREVVTTTAYGRRIEFLRGQIYLLLDELPQARADLEVAVKATPDKPEVEYAVGQVRERMGDLRRRWPIAVRPQRSLA